MKCTDLRELLSAYADGEIGPSELNLLEQHLGRCGECRTILADYQEMDKQISLLKAMPKQTEITLETMAKIKAMRMTTWKPSAWQMAGAGVVLIALIIGLVIGISLIGGKTDFAVAAEKIARNSGAFKTASVGEGEVSVEQVIRQDEAEATVVFSTEKGNRIEAQVDVKANRVMELKIFGLKVEFPPNPEFDLDLSQAEREEAIKIAVSAPTITQSFGRGVEITHVFGRTEDGKRMADVGILPDNPQFVIVTDEYYMIEGKSVRVDLDNKEVLSVNEFGISVSVSQELTPSE